MVYSAVVAPSCEVPSFFAFPEGVPIFILCCIISSAMSIMDITAGASGSIMKLPSDPRNVTGYDVVCLTTTTS